MTMQNSEKNIFDRKSKISYYILVFQKNESIINISFLYFSKTKVSCFIRLSVKQKSMSHAFGRKNRSIVPPIPV